MASKRRQSGSGDGSDPAESGSKPLPPVTGNGSSDGSGPVENGSIGRPKEALEESGARQGNERFVIPDGINEMSLVEAAHFYHGRLGWAVHPLLSHDKGDPKQRGKKPTHSGWRDWTPSNPGPMVSRARLGGKANPFQLTAISAGRLIVRPPLSAALNLGGQCGGGPGFRSVGDVVGFADGGYEGRALCRERPVGEMHHAEGDFQPRQNERYDGEPAALDFV